MKIYHSASSKETELLGEMLAAKVSAKDGSATGGKSEKHALVFALRGNLGSGKTTFVKGFFRGLGIKNRVKSPTFVIFRRCALRSPRLKNLYHVDAYRLKKPKDLVDLGFNETLSDPKNIILIEWPENIKGIVPRGAHRLEFNYGKKENERKIIIKA